MTLVDNDAAQNGNTKQRASSIRHRKRSSSRGNDDNNRPYSPNHVIHGKVLGTSASHEQRDFLKYGNSLGNSSSKFDKTLGGSAYKNHKRNKATDMRVQVLPMKCFRDGPEFDFLEASDVIFRIEHCCNCHSHAYKSRHDEEQYRSLAQDYKALLADLAAKYAVRCYVYVTPIRDHDPYEDKNSWNFHHNTDYSKVIDGEPGKSGGNKNIWSMLDVLETIHLETSTIRHGAFEIQMGVKNHANQSAKHIIHSKLYSGVWPEQDTVEHLVKGVLDEYFGYYAALSDTNPVPKDLYEENVKNSESVFIFDGTLLGDVIIKL